MTSFENTQFIDNITVNPKKNFSKITVFERFLSGNSLEIGLKKYDQPKDFQNVEFIGHTLVYGDVFKVWNDNPNDFTLFLGKKGNEFDVKFPSIKTNFIDNITKKEKKVTKFIKVVIKDGKADGFTPSNVQWSPHAFDFVEFIGHDEIYGDTFKAWDKDREGFTLFFGERGDEFNN